MASTQPQSQLPAILTEGRATAPALRIYLTLGYLAVGGLVTVSLARLSAMLQLPQMTASRGLAQLAELGYVQLLTEAPGGQAGEGRTWRVLQDPAPVLRAVGTAPEIKGTTGGTLTYPTTGGTLNPKKPRNSANSRESTRTPLRYHQRYPNITEPRIPNRSARFIDAMTARGKTIRRDYDLSARDHGAIKQSTADPDLLAEAFVALQEGLWGDRYLRQRMAVHVIVDQINSYRSWRGSAHAAPVERHSTALREGSGAPHASPAGVATTRSPAGHSRVSFPEGYAPAGD